MTTWLHELALPWLALLALGVMLLFAAVVFAVVIPLATGDRGLAFRSVSPGLLPPLGLVFGLLVRFLAAQVWTDHDRAEQAVDREASALRSVVLLSRDFPPSMRARVDRLVRRHIQEVVADEWPAMAHGRATLTDVPTSLAALLQLALHIEPRNPGQTLAQRELVTSVEDAFDARRTRIVSSESSFNFAKWGGIYALAIVNLLAIAFVQSGNRISAGIALALFATAAAACLLVIAIQDRPFAGPYRVRPHVLLEVEPPA
jgi:hypothetical protein